MIRASINDSSTRKRHCKATTLNKRQAHSLQLIVIYRNHGRLSLDLKAKIRLQLLDFFARLRERFSFVRLRFMQQCIRMLKASIDRNLIAKC